MNTNILKKCIEALKAETPDLSYLRGMLETLLEMQQEVPKDAYIVADTTGKVRVTTHEKEIKAAMLTDEASILDAQAKIALETLKNMGQPIDL